MENDSSIAHSSDNGHEKGTLCNEDTNSLSPDNVDGAPPKEVPDNSSAIETTEASNHDKEDIAQKVEGTTISHTLDVKDNQTKDEKTLSYDDISLRLFGLLRTKKNEYHHINLETNLCHNEDYGLIKWSVQSANNKQKVKTFTFKPRRKCRFTISANGIVNVSIECNLHPYEFHTPSGLVEFFGSCGQAFGILQQAAKNRLNVVHAVPEWRLIDVDYNKTLSAKDMDPIVNWARSGKIRVEHMGSVFQVYPKSMPGDGKALRFDCQYTTKGKRNNVVDVVKDIVDGSNSDGEVSQKLPFVTAEEMVSGVREKRKSNGDRISMDST